MNHPVSPMAIPADARLNGFALAPEKFSAGTRGRARSSADPLRINYPALKRLAIVLGGLFVSYRVTDFLPGDGWLHLVNWMGPAVLLAACFWTTYEIVRANPHTLWTPIPWLLLACGLFFGLGPLSYTFSDEEMIAYMNAHCPVDAGALWRTNVLNTLGIFLIVITFLLSCRVMDRHSSRRLPDRNPPPFEDSRANTAAYIFLGVGLPLQYLLILPYELGFLSFVLPGSIGALSALPSLAIFMLAYLSVKSGGRWPALFWMLFCTEIAVKLLMFNKSAFLMVFIMAVLGRYQASRKWPELIVGVIFTFSMYLAVKPIVSWSRVQIGLKHGYDVPVPLEERFDIAKRGLELWSMGRLSEEHHGGWWTRFSYASVQTIAMNLYDNGRPGESFGLAVYGLVPRFIWPDKPTITPGADFSEIYSGTRTTQTGMGVFGEAYWNGGWPFVVFSCCYIGVLFAWLSRTALVMLARSEWLLLPCAFMGIQSGFQITSWFASTYVNGIVLYLAYYWLICSVLDNSGSRATASQLDRG